jgi:hypothetical protein
VKPVKGEAMSDDSDGKGMAGGSARDKHQAAVERMKYAVKSIGPAEAERRIREFINDDDPRHGGYGHICSEVCEVWLLVEMAEDYGRLLGDGVTEDNQPDILRRVRGVVESEQCERRGNWCHTHDRFAIACVRFSPPR